MKNQDNALAQHVRARMNELIDTLGSTAIGVLNNASCDVLAVRQPDQTT